MKRPATAVAACASLLVGAFLPLAFSNDAQATVRCTGQTAAYQAATRHLAAAEHRVKKARKGLTVAKRHHAPVKVVTAKREALKVARANLRYATVARQRYLARLRACQGTATPQGSATPKPTGTASPTATSTTGNPLSDLIGTLRAQLAGAGAPAPLIDALAQLQSALAAVPAPSGMDPAAFQQVLTDAAVQVQAEIAAAFADPNSLTATTLIDDILHPIAASLTAAGVPGLPGALTTLQGTLDPLLAQIPGLGALTGGLPLP